MTDGAVFTIGHGSSSPEAVAAQLAAADVSYVVDVRSAPYSRFQPEFSREPFRKFLEGNGIRYVFMGDLLGGRPRDLDCYSQGKVDYTRIRSKDFFLKGISRLKSAHRQGLRVCLLCSERHPSHCHRAKLVAVALTDEGIDVTHLLPNGERQSQAEVMATVTEGQSSLFGEHLTSRKAYR